MIKDNDEEQNRKAELTLLAEMMKLPNRSERRRFAEKIGISWQEYQYLLKKWKHLINRVMLAGETLTEKEEEKDTSGEIKCGCCGRIY